METPESFLLHLAQNNRMFSFDIAKEYHHFRLHPSIRNVFIFRVNGRYNRSLTLYFRWDMSFYDVIKILRPLVQFFRHRVGMRINLYIDDFLVASSTVTKMRVTPARTHWLLTGCRLQRRVQKGSWDGS